MPIYYIFNFFVLPSLRLLDTFHYTAFCIVYSFINLLFALPRDVKLYNKILIYYHLWP